MVRKGSAVFILILLGGILGTSGVKAYELSSPLFKPLAAPVGTGFTYQGYLADSESPANGEFDFQFKLYDDPSVGSQVGSIVTLEDISVTEGYFSVELDFGSVFDGTALWLEVSVRQGASSGGYQQLLPRQPINAVPHASFAAFSQNADTLDGMNSTSFSLSNHAHVVSEIEYLYIPGTLFQCLNPGSGGTCISSEYGYKWAANVIGLTTIVPVQLPDGATVTELHCYWYDKSSDVDADITIKLKRHQVLGIQSEDMASLTASTSGISVPVLSDSTTSITNPVIDTQNFGYFIYFSVQRKTSPDLLDANIRNYGCRIKYSFTEIIQ